MAKKTVSAESAAPAAALPPQELLQALDGWLSATGHDGAHPWRQSIASTLRRHPAEKPRRTLFEPLRPYPMPNLHPLTNAPAWVATSALSELLRLAEVARDIAQGTHLLASVIEADAINADFHDEEEGRPDPAVLSERHTHQAMRFAMAAQSLLAERAEAAAARAIGWANQVQQAKEGDAA